MATEEILRPLASEQMGAGERLVLVHGFTQTRRSMLGLAHRLAPMFEVVLVDLPFHGASPAAASLEEAAEMLGETGGEASYLGYSLGGRVCLTLALEHPKLVRRLVLIGATPGIALESERARRRAADEQLAARLTTNGPGGLTLEEFYAEWLAGPLFAHLSASEADLESRLANTSEGLADALRHLGTGTQAPSQQRLRELAMPVLLLAGANDAKFAAIAAEMKALIGANATHQLIAGAGHAAPFERPEEVLAALQRFFAAPARATRT